MTRKPKSKQFPSETYAARVARGRVPVSLSLSREAADRLTDLAEAAGETKSAIVARLVMSVTPATEAERMGTR